VRQQHGREPDRPHLLDGLLRERDGLAVPSEH
jgi:hypothetical protein